MPHSLPLRWLTDRYAQRPAAIRKLLDLTACQPARWDADQEARYRGRVIPRLQAMLEIAESTKATDKAAAFQEKFTDADALEIQRLVTYLIFLIIPDGDWPEPVAWDSAAGCPRVYHLETMLTHADALVLGLLAIRLREARDAQ